MKHSIFRVPSLALAGLTLVACAHPSVPKTAVPAPKEVAAVNIVSPAPYRPSTLAEHPELTPEEIGRRFLALIDSLKSFDELSGERVQKVMRLPLIRLSEKDEGFLTMTLPDSAWRYSFGYGVDPKYRRYTNAVLEFINENERINSSLLEDMEAVCGLDFNVYEAALTGMGFKRDDPGDYDELGRLLALQYLRNNVRVQIIPRREANAPDAKLNHACVSEISVHAFGP
ncbi:MULTISPECIES: hypothetical protein [unclassified Lysobacter]|uniref:hypothetical protein n=1 Tax=unclassified Lysobacter TaxID=2635362 RepID=UPI001BEADB7B|nr:MULTISPECIES: hypothetical protein [unclassified Lysobacter]MBT2748077.1 hypothetical protein [Lysobacter sp. ISL-42]MBT2750388.1 hypothetical protein [Lysobacter sp. ISL-50]MBT2781102.1 hypothetical protein [Lysobacter sp. ISL-52]